jgi:CubicO group peptidase (beta-lactamase class C family)
MTKMTRRAALGVALAGGGAAAFTLKSEGAMASTAPVASLAETIDARVRRAMAMFEQPGLMLAVVKDGQPLLARGYGRRRIDQAAPVDEATLFSIASCGKAFTAALLAQLVDEKKIAWDDPVRKHLPGFAMHDPYRTEHMTVLDLLVHRSGLGSGQGDLMIWPHTTHSRAEIVAGLRHLKPKYGFRERYAYDNILYIVAGELIAAVTGMRYEDALSTRILKPLGMADSVPSGAMVRTANAVLGHVRQGGGARGLGQLTPQERRKGGAGDDSNGVAAGGLWASARDMAKWLQVQLGEGALPGGGRAWSADQARMMWRPQVVTGTPRGPTPDRPDRPNFSLYGLGWQLEDYRGAKLVWHPGAGHGMLAMVAMLPQQNFGLAIAANAETGVLQAIRNTLLDLALGHDEIDWLNWVAEREKGSRGGGGETKAPVRPIGAAAPSLPLAAYAGVYKDAWYGRVTVKHSGGSLTIDFEKTPGMNGRLEPWEGESFRTHFADPSLENAVLTFVVEKGRVAGATARALSPDADFSYDFQDLDLRKSG